MSATCGWPLEVWVTAAGVQDRDVGAELLERVKQDHPSLRKVWVDSAYVGLVGEVGQEIGVDVEVVRPVPSQKGFHVLL